MAIRASSAHTKNIIVQLYSPHDGQIPVHESRARFRVVNCGRRFGKTTMAANDEMKFALDYDEVFCWWVAPTARQAKIAYRLMKRALKDILTKHNDTDMRLELPNGSIIECRSCDDPDNLRGEGIHFMVVEEAAMIPDATWFGVLRPMLSDTNGKAIFISTPKGHNWFYIMYQRGLDPLLKDYESFIRPTSSNPYIDSKEIEDARRDLPEDLFEQEYLAVFRDNASAAFKGIDACIAGELCDPVAGTTYEVGFDVAKYQDFSVMAVFNTRTQHLDAYYRVNNTDYTAQVDTLAEICTAYNDAHVLMDCTGVGAAVMEMVKGKEINVDGYLYTNTSKTTLIGELIVGIQHRDLNFPDIPILVAELRGMQVKYTPSRLLQYEAPSGGTDDFVNALGLAYHAGKAAVPAPYAIVSSMPQQNLPRAHEASDDASDEERDRLTRRQTTVSQFLRDVHLTGRFGR
jgi:hypothetical protein